MRIFLKAFSLVRFVVRQLKDFNRPLDLPIFDPPIQSRKNVPSYLTLICIKNKRNKIFVLTTSAIHKFDRFALSLSLHTHTRTHIHALTHAEYSSSLKSMSQNSFVLTEDLVNILKIRANCVFSTYLNNLFQPNVIL